MESTLRALRFGAILSALFSLQIGCCTIDLNCSSRNCSSGCGPRFERDPLFDGTLKHRVKGSIHSCANKIACAGGCGEVYWDESINDPAVCDSCGHLGVSSACGGSCSPWFVRLAKLWGTPYHASCSDGTCNDGSCASGSCLGHGALINHLRGHTRCGSCTHGTSVSHNDCPSCQSGYTHGHDGHLDATIYEDRFHEGSVHEGALMQPSGAGVKHAPTPAKPKELQNAESSAPASAQNRMRLHQRAGQSDPNGRLSAQLVNGHKRLVSNP